MSIPDTEPDIRVGLITCGAPLLAPRGEYEISRDAGELSATGHSTSALSCGSKIFASGKDFTGKG